MQLDSDEDGPPIMPAGIVAADANTNAHVPTASDEGHDDEPDDAQAPEPSLGGTTAVSDEHEGLGHDSQDTPFDGGCADAALRASEIGA